MKNSVYRKLINTNILTNCKSDAPKALKVGLLKCLLTWQFFIESATVTEIENLEKNLQ